MKIKAQSLIEYALIFVVTAVALFTIMKNSDLKSIRNYVFSRPASNDPNGTGYTITIESMTGTKNEVMK